MEPEDPYNNNTQQPTLFINFNLIKVNVSMVIACVLLSYFKAEYEYINAVYNILLTILIYNNLVFLYIIYKNLKSL
jgi:hypothetical protein